MLNFPLLMRGSAKFYIPYAASFVQANSSILSLPASATPDSTDLKKLTISTWIRRNSLGTYQTIIGNHYDALTQAQLYFGTDNRIYYFAKQSSATRINIATLAQLTNTSDYMHVYVKLDTTQAVATDRFEIQLDGVPQTLSIAKSPVLDDVYCSLLRPNMQKGVGAYPTGANYCDVLMAETHMFDGSLPPVTDFGQIRSSVWVPKAYRGSEGYGNLGIYFDYADSGNLGKDLSGNSRDYTNSNVTQSTVTPTS